jgi:hypothetical protein
MILVADLCTIQMTICCICVCVVYDGIIAILFHKDKTYTNCNDPIIVQSADEAAQLLNQGALSARGGHDARASGSCIRTPSLRLTV